MGLTINSDTDEGGYIELSFRYGFDANVALVFRDIVLGCHLGELCLL